MIASGPGVDWATLRTQALLGTDRQPSPPVSPVDGPVEAALLAAALVESTRRRAGTRPRHYGLELCRAPEEQQPFAPARAGQLLELLLAGQIGGTAARGRLLELWLRHCVDAGMVAPVRALPQILESAAGLDGDLVARAVGERGRWLAAANPAWWRRDDDHGGESDARWPENWAALPARQRAEAVEALRPSAEDEPMLEAALDDRAKSVRRAAAVKLAALPSSARAQRMRLRLEPLLHAPGRSGTMVVDLPELPTRDEIADATEDPPTNASVREWWLAQLIAGAPLDVWPAPPAVVAKLLASEGTRAAALATAVRRQRDRQWAGALLDAGLLAPALFELADPTDAERVLARAMVGSAAIAAIRVVPGPWSRQASAAVIGALAERKPAELLGLLGAVAVDLGIQLDSSAVADVERWRSRIDAEEHRRVVSLLGTILHILSLRAELHEVFS